MLFRILGPLEIWGRQGVVELSADKPRRLLSILLREANSWVTTDRLVEEIWPDGPPASASGNVKTYVSQLRRLVPELTIERRPGVYRLTLARTEVDTLLFEDGIASGRAALLTGDPDTAVDRLTDALALWRGQPYGSLDSEAAQTEAIRLGELRGTAQTLRAGAMLAAGRTDEAVTLLRALAGEDPLREPVWKLLIEALHASGRRADALSAYQQARRALVGELGLEPGPELQQLQQRLLREKPPPETPEPTVVRPDKRHLTAIALAAIVVGALVVVAAAALPLDRNPAVSEGGRPANAAPAGVSPKRPVPGQPEKLLFGIGDKAHFAMTSRLVRETPARMLTTWYHGPGDLVHLRGWRTGMVPRSYQQGFALHLIVGDWTDPEPLDTAHGHACGRKHPLSAEFLDHVRELAGIFAGAANGPPVFVTVFSGVDQYACKHGEYGTGDATTAYYEALKERYLQVREIFHAEAPNALVGLGWHSWVADYDKPQIKAGRSMIGSFADVLSVSDFQSVFSWEPEENVQRIRLAVKALSAYGPVMLAQYGADELPSPQVIDRDLRALFTDDTLTELVRAGLFAWNFCSEHVLDRAPAAYDVVLDTVPRWSRPAR